MSGIAGAVGWLLQSSGITGGVARRPGHATGSWPKFREHIIYDKKLQHLIAQTIDDPRRVDPTIFDVARLREMLREHLAGAANHRGLLFLLLPFGRWHEKFGPVSR